MQPVIFLSPHLDDVPLSCGGTLAELVHSGNPIQVITIFAGTPNPAIPISEFAVYQHTMWGTPKQAYQVRRAEDAAALAHFGLTSTWLDFFDCIYRGQPEAGIWYYNADPDIFGAVYPTELALVDDIIAALTQVVTVPLTQTKIYAPLTVGTHVDHQLAFLVGATLLAQGAEVVFYEEYPYADRDPANVTKALTETTPALLQHLPAFSAKLVEDKLQELWAAQVQPISSTSLQCKIEAIMAYQTQLDVLFGGPEAMIERVTNYAQSISSGILAERFWQLTL